MKASPLSPEAASVMKDFLQYDRDTGDFHWLRARPRGIKPGDLAGCITADGYRYIRLLNRPYYAHRLAWFYVTGDWPLGWLDHINGDRLDNRFSNLREANHSQNQQNLSVNRKNRSGLLGVGAARHKWRSTIRINGAFIHLGLFDNPRDAHKAYLEAKTQHHTFSPKARSD
jgi:hypothetical protein